MTDVPTVQTGFADIEGASLYYETAGRGPALILIHAGCADCRMWNEQFLAFAQHYRVTRYDLRGFGKSRLTPGPFSHRRDLVNLMHFLGMQQAHLVGSSMGAGMLIDFALENPKMAASLALVSSALGGYAFQGDMPKPLQELMVAINEKDLDRAAEMAVRIWIDGPRRTPDQVDARIRSLGREMSKTALPNFGVMEEPLQPPAVNRLNELAAPTLVVVGGLDDPSILAIGELLAAQIKGARKAVVPGAAHLLNLEKPDEFNPIVLGFLQGLMKFDNQIRQPDS